jgi:hypothetical protein
LAFGPGVLVHQKGALSLSDKEGKAKQGKTRHDNHVIENSSSGEEESAAADWTHLSFPRL